MTIDLVLVAIPLLGALLCWLLPVARAGQVVLAVVALEEACIALGSIGPSFGVDLLPSTSAVGRFALAIAALVVLISFSGGSADATMLDAYPSALVALAGVAAVALLDAYLIAAALAMTVVAIILLVTLVRFPGVGASLRTARRYLIWIALAGSGLVVSGALDRHYAAWATPGVLGPATALFVVGVAIFSGALPFALWLPAASDEAPNSAALACGLLGCAIAAILSGVVEAGLLLPADSVIHTLLGTGGGIAALGSAFLALGDKRPARTVAFLISANADVALAGLATGSAAAIPSVIWLLATQALSAAVTFACLARVGRVASDRGRAGWSALAGLAWEQPLLALALVVALLSLVGMPLTAGFVGRWNLATLATTNVVQSLAILLSSILGGAAIVRSFGTIFDPSDAKPEIDWTTDLVPALAAMLLIVGSLVPGQLPSLLL